MIENSNASKNPSTGEYVDVKKFVGVASINVLAINPNNETLRKYGWAIADDAEEPNYIVTKEDEGGKISTSTRVRFLVQIQDFDDKPVVALDFWARPEAWINKEGTKCQIIDSFGRTAWATKEEVKAKRIPQYSNGAASISSDYKMCHPGEADLVGFLMKYLNVTPMSIFDKKKNEWVNSKNPGKLTIDHWDKLCKGDVSELVEYISLLPDNRVKVTLGVRLTDDNKSYQTFLNSGYIGNGALPDKNTGEYNVARKAIDKFFEVHDQNAYVFSASPVKPYNESATEVEDNTEKMFAEAVAEDDPEGDLPF